MYVAHDAVVFLNHKKNEKKKHFDTNTQGNSVGLLYCMSGARRQTTTMPLLNHTHTHTRTHESAQNYMNNFVQRMNVSKWKKKMRRNTIEAAAVKFETNQHTKHP